VSAALDAAVERLRQQIERGADHIARSRVVVRAVVDAKRILSMAEDRKPKRSSLAMLSRVIASTGREQEDEAEALIKRRQRNHARFLELAAKGHANEQLREAMITESEHEQQLDDLEAAVGGNGGPTLDAEPDADTKKAREQLDAAKSSGNASDGGQGEGQQ
jgi:hypothetical protein